MVIFSTLSFFAFRSRFDSAAHKRFILIATNALLIAAIARWPLALVEHKPLPATFLSYLFLLLLVAYDLWSMHKVHLATAWGGTFMVVVQQLRVPLGKTPLWHGFADWMQRLAG
jgi:FtsH-binding integral membrane protein